MNYITKICESIKENNRELFNKLLLEDTCLTTEEEFSPIFEAITYKRINYLKALLKDDRFTISQRSLILSYKTNFNILKLLYKKIKTNKTYFRIHKMFKNILCEACYDENIEVINFILDNNICYSFSSDNHELKTACYSNRTDVAKIILKSNIYKNTENTEINIEPLFLVFKKDNFNMFKFLCETEHTKKEIKQIVLKLILKESIKNNKSKYINYLLENNNDLNFESDYCSNPLVEAIKINDILLFKKIFYSENIKLNTKYDLLYECIINGTLDIAEFLLKTTLIDTKTSVNDYIVSLPFSKFSLDIIEFLLSKTNIDLSFNYNSFFKWNYDQKKHKECSLLFNDKRVREKFDKLDQEKYNDFFISFKLYSF